ASKYADDTARMVYRRGAGRNMGGRGLSASLRNDVVTVSDFLDALQSQVPGHQVTYSAGNSLAFPADLDDSGLRLILGDIPHTPLPAAIRATLDIFKLLLAENRLDLSQLDS
ncbi:MAG: hypothetical protein HC875_25360, partial [Anaerolineales bacterium]|nr:hypothetical protein [Anaerolineales bacterium]